MAATALPPITRIELAQRRLLRGITNLRNALDPQSKSVNGRRRDPVSLTIPEVAAVEAFANSPALADRNARVTFHATDPQSGQAGTFTTSINELLLIDPSYDTARLQLLGVIERLVRDGILSWEPPAGTLPLPAPAATSMELGETADVRTGPLDTRHTTGMWGDFPPYSGVGPAHINKAQTALGYDRPQPLGLEGLPVPAKWKRLYPTPKLFAAAQYGNEAFVNDLTALTEGIVSVVRGANAHPEWHPALFAFNNGPQFPGPLYPPDYNPSLGANVEGRYQYKTTHRWGEMTRGAAGSAAGFNMVGRGDGMWQWALGNRNRTFGTQRHIMAFTNNWSRCDCADPTADFVSFANMASFVLELGASAHVHAACQNHATIAKKAQLELEMAPTAAVSTYFLNLQRERDANLARASASSNPIASIGTSLGLNGLAGEILAGGVIASMQLFMINPIAGGVALLLTGVATLLAQLLSGPPLLRIPEDIPVRDGARPVRTQDENGDPKGDIYGGNALPWTRKQAVMGQPVMRIKGTDGRVREL